MPRPRAFDPTCALDAALGVFRARGYEATSVQDLVDATGLSRSSLYATFGDKQALYLAALDRYGCAGGEQLAAHLDGAPSPLAGLRAYLDSVADEAPGCGCFAVNAAAERAATDAETAARAARYWRGLVDSFAGAVRQAQAAGEVDPGRDAGALGAALANTALGLRGMQNAGASRSAVRGVVATTFGALFG